jgi:8-oxo-dGTP pyrophosphatase MutT (NUDIX family)
MNEQNTEIVATCVCAVVVKNGRYLVVGRRKKPGFIGMPGGKIDPGETAAEAVVRELYEETGLRGQLVASGLPLITLLDDAQTYTSAYVMFLVETFEEDFQGPEGTPVFWALPSELTDPQCCEFPLYNAAVQKAFSDRFV